MDVLHVERLIRCRDRAVVRVTSFAPQAADQLLNQLRMRRNEIITQNFNTIQRPGNHAILHYYHMFWNSSESMSDQ